MKTVNQEARVWEKAKNVWIQTKENQNIQFLLQLSSDPASNVTDYFTPNWQSSSHFYQSFRQMY